VEIADVEATIQRGGGGKWRYVYGRANAVRRSVKLLLAFASTIILGFGPHGVHGHTFVSHDPTTNTGSEQVNI
jgi:hypothetical protein